MCAQRPDEAGTAPDVRLELTHGPGAPGVVADGRALTVPPHASATDVGLSAARRHAARSGRELLVEVVDGASVTMVSVGPQGFVTLVSAPSRSAAREPSHSPAQELSPPPPEQLRAPPGQLPATERVRPAWIEAPLARPVPRLPWPRDESTATVVGLSPWERPSPTATRPGRPVASLVVAALVAAAVLVGAVGTGVATLASAQALPGSCRPVTVYAVSGGGGASDVLRAVTDPLSAQFGEKMSVVTVPPPPPGGSYAAAETDAVASLASSVSEHVDGCPTGSLMLFGYSQGAQVAGDLASRIGTGLEPGIPAQLVQAVGLFGDPARSPQTRAVPEGTTGQGALPPRAVGFGSLDPRTIEICAPNDPVCDSPANAAAPALEQAVTSPVHASYPQLPVAAGTTAPKWAAASLAKVVAAIPTDAGPAKPPAGPAAGGPAAGGSSTSAGAGAGSSPVDTPSPTTSSGAGTTTLAPGSDAQGNGGDGYGGPPGAAGEVTSPSATASASPTATASAGPTATASAGPTATASASPTAPASPTATATATAPASSSAAGSSGDGGGVATRRSTAPGGGDEGDSSGAGESGSSGSASGDQGSLGTGSGGAGSGGAGSGGAGPAESRAPGSSTDSRAPGSAENRAPGSGADGSGSSEADAPSASAATTTTGAPPSGSGSARGGESGSAGAAGADTGAAWSLASGLEGFKSTPWNNQNATDPSAAPSPNVPGREAVKFEMPGGGKRTEAEPDVPEFQEGEKSFVGYSGFADKGFPTNTDTWQLIMQFKQPGTGSPPLAVEIGNGQLRLANNGANAKDFCPVSGGAPFSFQLGIQFGGAIDAWCNGQQTLTGYTTPESNVKGSAYLKTGIYRDESIKENSTLFLNDLKVGKTLEQVSGLAGASGGAAADAAASPSSGDSPAPGASASDGVAGASAGDGIATGTDRSAGGQATSGRDTGASGRNAAAQSTGRPSAGAEQGSGGAGGSGSGGAGGSGSGGQKVCEKFGSTDIDGGRFMVQNNEWGAADGQCVTATTQGFTVDSGNHSRNDAPAAYPSIMSGCWMGTCTQGTTLPTRISDLGPISSSIVGTIPAGTKSNLAYDLWADSTPKKDGHNDAMELMIWLQETGGINPIGQQTGTASIGGATWEVWKGTNGGVDVISYLRQGYVEQANDLPLTDFVKDAVAQGSVRPTDYLTNIQAGFEPWTGGPGMALERFDVRYGSAGAPATGTGASASGSGASTTGTEASGAVGASPFLR